MTYNYFDFLMLCSEANKLNAIIESNYANFN
jgi:hypothetical protein